MKKEIIINSALNEVRVAITEDSKLAEFFIELPDQEKYIRNIYLGKVKKILQGINAAFIDIGLNQDAFLHFSDVDESLENNFITDDDEDDYDMETDDTADSVPPQKNEDNRRSKSDIALRKYRDGTDNSVKFKTRRSGEVHINLKPKQDVIVQVVREAYSSKGVKVSTKIAIPGRYVVLLPFNGLVGVSQKIASFHERKRLRTLAKSTLPSGFGGIIRTAAQGKNEEELRQDWQTALEVWKDIEKKVQKSKSPQLLYQDMQLASTVIRDLFNSKIDAVHIDSKKLFKEITTYLKKNSPGLIDKVWLYNGNAPIFENFGIEKDIAMTYKRKVPLSGGGSIVIDQTEAMIVVDVNSGRAAETDQETNAFKTNMEAAREIARQLRLRDIGGMIVIDFIDMGKDSNRKKLFNEMRKELSKDRAKTVVYPLTQLSLLQITRQRINQYIVEKMSETCPVCHGRGRVTSKVVVLNTIERWLFNFRKHSHEFRLILYVNPQIAAFLTEGTISRISRLMIRYFVKIKVQQSETTSLDSFSFYSVKQQKDITGDFI
ncbi:MAG: ribonuclease [Bacteroidota bacterium]|nr:ribonuclease [Bacteroidota bacterium]